MKKNMGTFDRVLRVIVSILIGTLYFTETISGTLGVLLLVVAVIFAATSLLSFCPLYLPFNIMTTRKK